MNRIKELRKQNNLNQFELAKICNTTNSNISGWENNKWQPDNDALIKMAEYFNVTVDYIIGRNQQPQWTDEEKALGVGRHKTHLSEDEFEWLELRSEILRIHGENYLNTLKTMLNALTKE